MPKFRKKPVIIEAVEWTGKNVIEVYNFLENKNEDSSMNIPTSGKNFFVDMNNGTAVTGTLKIRTLEGDMIAAHGDYIIKGVKGEFYPCKPDIFEVTYETVEE